MEIFYLFGSVVDGVFEDASVVFCDHIIVDDFENSIGDDEHIFGI